MGTPSTQWLLLIVTLPTASATARMRVWRTLKSLGCASFRDGVFLLPKASAHRDSLQELADETIQEGGSAWVLSVEAESDADLEYRALFDRSADYAGLLGRLTDARHTLSGFGAQDINRLLRKLRRDYEAIRAIDYFPNDATLQAEAVWMDFVSLAQTALSPAEPQATDQIIPKLNLNDYQGKTWATRANLWVDRVASAWLIRRFIDRRPTFLWLDFPSNCPPEALGFDFDGATFTHVGDRVTFEVLLASFQLEQERGLMRLGAMIRSLDIGGAPVPEAAGFEAMLAGARQRAVDDDQLLDEMTLVLDSFYAHFSNGPQKAQINA
jgi:hypothetical protein